MAKRSVRIIVVGDLLVTPSGDPRGLGWLGRVLSRTFTEDINFEVIPLGVPNETTGQLAERWWAEVERRVSGAEEVRLVVALGNSDPSAGISISRSRLNLATVLDEATRRHMQPFVVGPVPSHLDELNPEIEHLAWGFEDVANRRQLPFVDCFKPLVEHEGWREELSNSDNGLPGQVGYGLIAWLVLNRGWNEWLGLSEA